MAKIKAENAFAFVSHCELLSRLQTDNREQWDFYNGRKIYEKLRRIELKYSRLSEAYCNGNISFEDLKKAGDVVEKGIRQLLPNLKHFYLNNDPRGYALKIDSEERYSAAKKPDNYVRNLGIYRDLGGFGILAPEF